MSFISWFVEGASAVASADVIANEKVSFEISVSFPPLIIALRYGSKVEMICLDDHMLSSLLSADAALTSRFFSYLIRLLSSRADLTLTTGMEWMKIWCKETTVMGRKKIRNQVMDLVTKKETISSNLSYSLRILQRGSARI